MFKMAFNLILFEFSQHRLLLLKTLPWTLLRCCDCSMSCSALRCCSSPPRRSPPCRRARPARTPQRGRRRPWRERKKGINRGPPKQLYKTVVQYPNIVRPLNLYHRRGRGGNSSIWSWPRWSMTCRRLLLSTRQFSGSFAYESKPRKSGVH